MTWINTAPKKTFRPPYLSFEVIESTTERLSISVRVVLLVRAGHEPKETFRDRSIRNLSIVRKFAAREVEELFELEEMLITESTKTTHSELVLRFAGRRGIVSALLRCCVKWTRLCKSTAVERAWMPPPPAPPRARGTQLELSYSGSSSFTEKTYRVPSLSIDEVADDTYCDAT
jgi:hypothetical protein